MAEVEGHDTAESGEVLRSLVRTALQIKAPPSAEAAWKAVEKFMGRHAAEQPEVAAEVAAYLERRANDRRHGTDQPTTLRGLGVGRKRKRRRR